MIYLRTLLELYKKVFDLEVSRIHLSTQRIFRSSHHALVILISLAKMDVVPIGP